CNALVTLFASSRAVGAANAAGKISERKESSKTERTLSMAENLSLNKFISEINSFQNQIRLDWHRTNVGEHRIS
ncbi:MAG TPA: hypothetical protein VGR36_00935, partial [Candidatus Acidoferrales bacterium]|nr:hypothetical protein [Candidatus Acidoferrales bacterium]